MTILISQIHVSIACSFTGYTAGFLSTNKDKFDKK